MTKEISIIIPVFNEAENIAELHKEIKYVCRENGYIYEIIVVDDGSTDKTPEVCKRLSPIRYIRLRKRFGQTAALDAGIKNAKNNYLITMDGDRQNDPDDIPNLVNHLEKHNFDVVSGWRKNRKDRLIKRFISRGANFLRGLLIHDDIHDSGCSLKIYKKECFDHLSLYGEMHRFIPALLKIKGFRIGEIVVNHRQRAAGKTKYGWKRTFKGFIDMIAVWFWNKYAVRPLHLLGGLGILFSIAGFASGVITLIEYIKGVSLSDTVWPLLTVFFVITGIQLFVFGLMADIMSKSYYETTRDLSYSVKEIVERE